MNSNIATAGRLRSLRLKPLGLGHVLSTRPSRATLPRPDADCRLPTVRATKSQAESAVENGLELFGAGDAQAALDEFSRARSVPNVTADELRAAVYNSACAYVKLKRWKEACDAIEEAINTHDVKLVVALRDPDLSQLRDRREWVELLGRVSGGIGNEGYAKLRAEASSPFQFVRLFLFGGLSAGAALGSVVSTARLLGALGGVYELEETAKTFGINIACLIVLGFLFKRELDSRQKNIRQAAKEEELAQLQVCVSRDGERAVPISAFRGMYRPIIIAGSKGQVKKSMKNAASFARLFAERGIVIIPVVLNDTDIDDKIQRLKEDASFSGFSSPSSKSAPTSTSKASSASPKSLSEKKWQLLPHDVKEWREWIQKLGLDSEGALTEVYAQIQLDGVVRSSGLGPPPFEKLISDIPQLESVQTRFGDGRGYKS
jgi:hypothetical protein